MEIIAKRQGGGILTMYCIVGMLGIGCIVFSCFSSYEADVKNVLTVLGAIVAFIGIINCTRMMLTPKVIIRYDGEALLLREGKYTLDRISQVYYEKSSRGSYAYTWGKIVLRMDDRKIVYNFVENVEEVYNRLMDLRSGLEK